MCLSTFSSRTAFGTLSGLVFASSSISFEVATQNNIPAVVASGNQRKDLYAYSPFSVPSSISVGATYAKDVALLFSNHGGQ